MPLSVLYIVVPCYNEQDVLPVTAPLFLQELQVLGDAGLIDSVESRVLFVDDGSTDETWRVICGLASRDARCQGIRQSRNRGQQNAILAGLMEARGRCDITISIDADGQDDPAAMEDMVRAYHEGCEVVYGVRASREGDSAFKRFTAQRYYKTLNAMGCEVVYDHADYRLISARVLEALGDYEEVNVFLRGMIPLVGFKSTSVFYNRDNRRAGKSHYSLAKMTSLAVEGITSLSVVPLRIATVAGLVVSVLSFIGIIWVVVTKLMGNAVDGWSSMTAILLFVTGIQLLVLGILGEYIGKIYLETKRRPRYIISDRTYDEPGDSREPQRGDGGR